MEPSRFAATKIQPPRQWHARVQRPQLDTALREALLTHRVVLLQAAAGFGKTSTLAAQLSQQQPGEALAWVSLDPDDDAERLFACLVAALEGHDLPWRTAPEALIELAGADDASRRRAATELLNALAGAEVTHGLIVLDDLHRLQATSAFALLDLLVERLPPRWTLLLASRTTPPLALARPRAEGALAEFTQDDLRFSRSEAESLLAAAGAEAQATAARAGDLFERTAGWPAGLRLALAALRTRGGQAAAGRQLIDRHLFDYLAAEVLDDLPGALHDFLLRSAVLPELTAPRAAAVSGDRRAADWLAEIERRGLFATALDADEPTLVLHDLFRDALLRRLAERLPHEMPALLHRAAAGEPDALRRIGYLQRAGDWPAADAALAEAAPELFLHGGAGELLRLAEAFPAEQRSARIARLAGTACSLRWQWNEMARWLEQAVQRAESAGDEAERQLAMARLAYALYPLDRNDEALALLASLEAQTLAPGVRTLVLQARSMQQFRMGQHPALRDTYAELLSMLQAGEPLMRWWECVPPFNWSTIAGMPQLIERYLAGATPRLAERPLAMRGELRLLQTVQRLWAGDLPGAAEQLAAAREDIRWLAVSGEAEVGTAILGMIHDAMHGRGETVQQTLESLAAREDHRPSERRVLWRHQIAVYGVRLSDTLGDAEALQRWASQLKENPLRDDAIANPRAIATRARHAAAQQRWADAAALFEALAPKLATMDVMGQRTDLSLRHAHVLLRLQRLREAAAVLAPVLERLLAERVRGQALLAGPALLMALAAAPWGGLLAPALVAELQAAAQLAAAARRGDEPSAPAAAPKAGPDSGEDGLSSREREVLERIAAGDSNKVIARMLDISPHTVKRHVANILDKLGLASRGQAAAWLREHAG